MNNHMLNELVNFKSTRVFSEQPIDEEIKRSILQIATFAPTAGNMMMYAMIDVVDQSLKDQLSITCDNQPFIKTAPLVVVFCSDNHRFNTGARHFYNPDFKQPEMGDFLLAVSDTLIMAHHAVLAAHGYGIGSCYIGDILENIKTHQQLLQLPDHVIPIAMVVFGYPTQSQQDRVKPKRFDLDFVLSTNTYQEKKLSDHEKAISKRNEAMNLHHIKAKEYYTDYGNRKVESEFMKEMNRSCEQIVKRFLKEK